MIADLLILLVAILWPLYLRKRARRERVIDKLNFADGPNQTAPYSPTHGFDGCYRHIGGFQIEITFPDQEDGTYLFRIYQGEKLKHKGTEKTCDSAILAAEKLVIQELNEQMGNG